MISQLFGVEREETGEEQLIIVAVSGEEENIGIAFQRGLPPLNKIRNLTMGENIELGEDHTAVGEIQGHRADFFAQGGCHINILMEVSVGAGGEGVTGGIIGDSVRAVKIVKQKVQRTDGFGCFQGEGAVTVGTGNGTGVAVCQIAHIADAFSRNQDILGKVFGEGILSGNGSAQARQDQKTEKAATNMAK